MRYNRENVAIALKAMQRYSEVKAKRERVFYKQRMSGNRERQLETDKKLVAENQHLLPKEYRTLEQEQEVAVAPMAEKMEIDEEEEELELEKRLKSASIKQSRKLRIRRSGGFDEE